MNHFNNHVIGRIKELSDFYVSNDLSTKSLVIEWEDSKVKLMNDEMIGQLVIEQFKKASETVRLWPFICCLEDGGVDIEEIRPIEEYLEAEKSIDGEELSQLEEEFGEQRLRAAGLKKKFESASVEIKRMEQVVIDQFSSKSTADEEPAAKVDEGEAAVKSKSRDAHGRFTSPGRRENQEYVQELGMEAERIYDKWEGAREKCSRLLKDHRNLLSAAQMRAKNRFAEDSDAMTRMRVAMTALTNFMVRLLRKFPEAENVARDMGGSKVDPLAKGDLRQVLANLSKRYQREDNLGVVAFVVSKIGENQANKSLGQLTRSMEEFMQYMHRLKVETVSVSDLTAMIQLAGMNEKQRLEFFRLEAQLALTGRLFDDNCDVKSGSGSVGSWSQGSLFDRLRLFAKSIDEVSLMSDKFKTQQPLPKPDASRNAREEKTING
jgi:hypothetical protein